MDQLKLTFDSIRCSDEKSDGNELDGSLKVTVDAIANPSLIEAK